MKKYRLIFLSILLTTCLSFEMQADHFMGGQLSYETIDLDSLRGIFRITLRLERPCNSLNKFNSELTIKVLEFDAKRSPAYNLSIYAAKLTDSSYIYYPCTAPTATCNNSGGQVIEVKYFTTQIVVSNSQKECVVFFDEYSNRSYSDNLMNPDDPMILYTSFIPAYSNTQVNMTESQRHFPIRGQLSNIKYTISDTEGDSLSYDISIPFKALNYTANASNLSYILVKSQAKTGLNDQKPFYIQENKITIGSSAMSFTPTVAQYAWLTYLKSEFRKIKSGIKDTWICIGKSNTDRLFHVSNINSQFSLSTIVSPSPTVKVNGTHITICNNNLANTIQFNFPIESGIQVSRYKIYSGLADISSQFTANRKSGSNGMDTFQLNINYLYSGVSDLTTNLKFDFELCHTASGIGFDKSQYATMKVFNHHIFSQDTILSCASILSFSVSLKKPFTLNWGNYSPIHNTITIVNPRDTWIIAQLSDTNSACPSKDSVFINQGSIFTLTTASYMPSCKGYADAAAKVSVQGTNGPFSFQWSNSSTLDSISSILAGKHFVVVRDKDNCNQLDSVIIPETAGIEAHWVMDSPITCYGGDNGRGHIEVTSMLKPSQYLWTSVIAVDSFLDNLSAGNYLGSYRYTNLANKLCDQPFMFKISEPDSISLNIVKTDNTCFGDKKGKIAVLPIGGYGDFVFYFDSVPSTVGFKENLANDTIQIYVRDRENCHSSVHSIMISSPPKMNYTIQTVNPSCTQVSNGQLSINHANGGKSPYLFSFSNSEYGVNSNFTNLSVGTYNIKMRDANDCIFSQNFTLNPSYILHAKPDLIEDSKCPLSHSGKIHLTITNGQSPYKIYFSKDSNVITNNSLQFNNLIKGNYLIQIVDNNKCAWSAQYQIAEPDTIRWLSEIKHETCFGFNDGEINLTILGGGTPAYSSQQWYNANNSLLPNSIGLSPGKYTLKFEDSRSCNYKYEFYILGNSKLNTNLEISKSILCHGYTTGAIKSNAMGGISPYRYNWKNFPNSMTNEISNLSAGTYILEVLDANNCAAKDSIILNQPNPITLESIKIKNADCPRLANGALTILALNGNGSNSSLLYKLKGKTDFTSSKTIVGLMSDIYTIVVRDTQTCEKEFIAEIKTDKSLEVQLPSNLAFEIGEERLLLPVLIFGENTKSSDINSYSWNPKNYLSCSDCLSPNFIALKSDNYTIEVDYGKGCKSSSTSFFEVSKPEDIYIPNSFSPNGDGKNDIWNVYGKYIIGYEAKIFNRVGELVFYSQDIQKGWDGNYLGLKEYTNQYKYIIKVTYADKSQKTYEGSLNLFR